MIAAMKRLAGGDRRRRCSRASAAGMRSARWHRPSRSSRTMRSKPMALARKAGAGSAAGARNVRSQIETLCHDFDRQVTKRLETVTGAVSRRWRTTAQSMSRVAEQIGGRSNHVSTTSESGYGQRQCRCRRHGRTGRLDCRDRVADVTVARKSPAKPPARRWPPTPRSSNWRMRRRKSAPSCS